MVARKIPRKAITSAAQIMGAFFLLLYGGLIVAVVFGVIAALRQRLKEIEGGEEEDAKKY